MFTAGDAVVRSLFILLSLPQKGIRAVFQQQLQEARIAIPFSFLFQIETQHLHINFCQIVAMVKQEFQNTMKCWRK